MIALLLALSGAYGVWLLWTAIGMGWSGVGVGPRRAVRHPDRHAVRDWLIQAGLDEVRPAEFMAVVGALFFVGAGLAYALFGGILPPLCTGLFAATFPIASYRSRRDRRRSEARDAWPRMIEEIRILTGALGRSVPQALLEVGRRGPQELQPAFAAAEREWLLSTDFPRTVSVLQERLADATADVVCETLLVAHEVGGTDLDGRLAALAEDRTSDVQSRKDARARQAGVRFARRFVLAVPVGMALAGLSIGTGRRAYGTVAGQALVAVGIAVVAACWLWAGRLMRLPDEPRVLDYRGRRAV